MARPLVAVQGRGFTNDWLTYLDWRDRFADALDITHTADWLDKQVWACVYRLFASKEAAILAEITTHPSGVKSVDGVLAAGDLDGIKALIEQAEAWGIEQGAAFAQIESRPAWAKLLPDYEINQVKIVKGLSSGIIQ